MRATRSGIGVGLALALLVPGSVAGQEPSPPAEAPPSPAAASGAECVPPEPPAEGTLEAELGSRVATLDGQVAAVVGMVGNEGDSSMAMEAIEELAAQVRAFGRQVAGRLELPAGAAAAAAAVHRATKSDADDLLSIISATAPSADDPEFTLPATSAALSDLRSALGLPAPCPTSDAMGTSVAESAMTSDAAALKSIDDLLATEMEPQGQKAILIAIETAYATDSSAEDSGEWSREAVLEVVKDTECPEEPECVSLVTPLFATYVETGNRLFFDAAEMVWASTLNGTEQGDAYAAELRESLSGA